MKANTKEILNSYIIEYPFIYDLQDVILKAFDILDSCYKKGSKILVCGNGGSSADADHIVGELCKGFMKKRPLDDKVAIALSGFGEKGKLLSQTLQQGLPAINLCAHISLLTATINDISADAMYAQQVLTYGVKNDVYIGISTSGNSENVYEGGIVSNVLGMKSIALTGESGGKMKDLFDLTINVPFSEVSKIQDAHSCIYHLLCKMIESDRWEV